MNCPTCKSDKTSLMHAEDGEGGWESHWCMMCGTEFSNVTEGDTNVPAYFPEAVELLRQIGEAYSREIDVPFDQCVSGPAGAARAFLAKLENNA
jgi:hypothetical protein